jgi:hypothetical protein
MALDGNESLSTRHISQNLSSYEAARTGFFVLEIPNLGELVNPSFSSDPENAQDTDKLESPEEYLRLNVIKAPVPHFSITTNEYRRGNDVVKFAGIPTWDDGDIVVDDVVGLKTKDILLAWLYLAYNPHTRKGGRMWQYKKTAILHEYTQDYEEVRSWEIQGMFITKISEGEFDRENDGKRQLTATFSYDRAIILDNATEEE